MRPTRQNLEKRLSTLEAQSSTDGDRLEMLAGKTFMYDNEPTLTNYLVSLGFVVAREQQVHSTGSENVLLHTTPSADDLFHSILWHYGGPTAPRDDLRIIWDSEQLETVIAAAEHPVEHHPSGPHTDAVVVNKGDGWEALAPDEYVVENMVCKRSEAENAGYDILGPVPPQIEDADTFDLVEVDADPITYSERPR